MSTIDEMLAKQHQLMDSISRAMINVRKLGQAKMTRPVLQGRMERVKDAFQQFRDIDAKLRSNADAKMINTIPYFTDHLFQTCEDKYEETADELGELIARHSVGDETDLNVSQALEYHSRASAKLPQINLPTFNGAFENWESFRDQFQSLIIENRSLANVDRLHYLRASLTGEAGEALRHLAITDSNFSIAWDLVVARFEDKRRLIHCHLNSLFTLPNVTGDTARGIRGLRDKANGALQALKTLKRPVDEWGDVLVYLITHRLDHATREAWELFSADSLDYPSYSSLDAFLQTRLRALDALAPDNSAKRPGSTGVKVKSVASHSTGTNAPACPVCKANHTIYACQTFLKQTPAKRVESVQRLKLCLNCLRGDHVARNCPSKRACWTCHQRHHTLLHNIGEARSTAGAVPVGPAPTAAAATDGEIASHIIPGCTLPSAPVLLATARVKVFAPHGRCRLARALIDQGSAATLVSERFSRLLRLPRTPRETQITGIGDSRAFSRAVAPVTIAPHFADEPTISTLAYIVPALTRYLPRCEGPGAWPHTDQLVLADPDPLRDDPIDLILGADVYGQLLLDARRGTSGEPVAQRTILGWILSGPTSDPQNSAANGIAVHHIAPGESLDACLRRFWEIEDLPQKSLMTPDEARCERHFASTHSRDNDGRYVVRIPFKAGPPVDIGESRSIALASFLSTERRMAREKRKADLYNDFLREYEELGHMRRLSDPSRTEASYYIPHHAILREDRASSKIRVVFNASSRSRNGVALNDLQHVGPKLQSDLPTIILRWRQHKYVYSADIAKMFRQIRVHEEDVPYQRILHRSSSAEPIGEYELLTVTYGMTSAPFLANRVIKQLAEDEGAEFPLAVEILSHHIYVDDIMFGADDLTTVSEQRAQVTSLLEKGGFTLHKWTCNHPAMRDPIPPGECGSTSIDLQGDDTIRLLGVVWSPRADSFHFRVKSEPLCGNTKRKVLSRIARLFDPLGWVSPVVIVPKIFMQDLWAIKGGWDEILPPALLSRWETYYGQLKQLESISIPRWTPVNMAGYSVEIHGFSDASIKAYGASVYIRVTSQLGEVAVSLLAAKAKVAPLKTLSIPRLELSGALLLARLVHFVHNALHLREISTFCWSDSQVTLAWIARSPSHWKPFVANRVSEIHAHLPNAVWRYVPTADNPADCASRGVSPKDLGVCKLWWNGPPWLALPANVWPKTEDIRSVPQAKVEERASIHSARIDLEEPWELAYRYSSWLKLLKITAYVVRFVRIIQTRLRGGRAENPGKAVFPLDLVQDVSHARLIWLKDIQRRSFSREIQRLRQGRNIKASSEIIALCPYLDEHELLRVGGRLENADLPELVKHPIILGRHPVTTMLIHHAHLESLHGGPQATLTLLRTEYWLPRARATVRRVLHKCVPCARERATVPTELMGNLPEARVTRPSRPFLHSGVDYAGPILVRPASGRGQRSHKAYVALFICLATRAIHLELVSQCTTDAFLAAFNRFAARRGVPQSMFSDNGTNFQGAARELFRYVADAASSPAMVNRLSLARTSWHFMPPSAPHFGGLWEAGVRSLKFHLRRCIGNHTLTIEEMNTLLCRAEACLNSRPVAAASDSIDDYRVLTPGHFLIGEHLMSVPEPSLIEVNDQRLSRWQLVQKISECLWKSWQGDYIHNLLQRPKWRSVMRLTKVGQIVLLRNPLAPPCQWELGRITQCHPGADGLTRVVTVKTAKSTFKRPIAKICFLPVEINADAEQAAATAGGTPLRSDSSNE